MTTKWFHGTSSESGLSDGDTIDPAKAHFEPAIWATSDRAIALRFAKATCAVHGGTPMVWVVELAETADIVSQTMAKTDYTVDADAIVFERGEASVPEIAILRKGIASVRKARR